VRSRDGSGLRAALLALLHVALATARFGALERQLSHASALRSQSSPRSASHSPAARHPFAKNRSALAHAAQKIRRIPKPW
jgi:hypothetical protein